MLADRLAEDTLSRDLLGSTGIRYESMPLQKDLISPVLVLGGSGFIGSRLVDCLIAQGYDVRIGDLLQSKSYPGLSAFCDVRDGQALNKLATSANTIINLAAEHRDDVRPLTRYYETNVHGAQQVCQAARDHGVHRIVFTSSVAVYGFHPEPVDEDGQFAPFNPYGQTKLQAEHVYKEWADEDQSRSLVIVRPTVVFGEGNRGNVYNLLNQIAMGRFFMVGSGTNFKSMAYVENVADFLAHALNFGPGIHIFNYVDGPDLNMNSLVDRVQSCLHRRSRSNFRFPKWLALAAGHCLDGVSRLVNCTFPISAIRIRKFCESTQFKADRVALTGFRPRFSLNEGLDRTIRFEFLAEGHNSRPSEVAMSSSES